jgi:hypothetical protein
MQIQKKMLRNSHPVVSTVLFIKIWKKKTEWLAEQSKPTPLLPPVPATLDNKSKIDRAAIDECIGLRPSVGRVGLDFLSVSNQISRLQAVARSISRTFFVRVS